MHIPYLIRRMALPAAALLLVSCAGNASAGWTYAPLGPSPTPAQSVAPTAAPPASPGGSGGGGAVTLEIKTTDADPLGYDPKELTMPAGATVTVNYLNDSSLPHNINFFDGPDQNSNSIAKTAVATGPGKTETVTFTAPSTPGDYFFWCDVHTTAMTGIYHVQ